MIAASYHAGHDPDIPLMVASHSSIDLPDGQKARFFSI
jgi:hypothetical protein